VSGSFPVFDAVVEQFIGWAAPTRALDIGAGAGKYGRLLRDVAPACVRVAVEIDPGHVERFALPSLYQRVDVADAADWWRQNSEENFDLVIVGDCLQNMAKSDGLDLLNAMVYRCGWLLVLAPEFIVQGAIDGSEAAVHRSVWSERDMLWHDLWAWDNARAIGLYALRGYRASTLDADTLLRQMNEGAVPVRDYDGQSVVRPCRLRLIEHPREVGYRPR
jgi:SAM-dependent methyltransferase